MKKSVSIILLFCMLICTGGYQLIFSCYQMGLKAEMKTYLRQNPHNKFNTVFTFSASNGKIADTRLKWEEEGKEFWVNGNLYDLISIDYHRSTAIVHCINDHAESKLIAQCAEIQQKQNQKSSGARAEFQKLLLSVFELSSLQLTTYFFRLRQITYSANDALFLTMLSEILKPPPESTWV